MKRTMEKISILALSLMLISTYSVSCVIPKMLEYFPGRTRESVEMLVSVPSYSITATILLNIWLTRIMSERMSILIGAVMLAIGGASPLITQNFEIMFVSRILLGFGIGMVNARAITMIQNRYDGTERATLLGFRGSVEVLGNTLMTFLAGRLMMLGWNIAFGIYLTIVPVLLMYLCFVTPKKETMTARVKQEQRRIGSYMPFFVLVFLLGWTFINTNVSTTMRMASLMLEKNLGTAEDASLTLSFMLILGVISGGLFERLLRVFRNRIMVFGLLCMGCGLLIVGNAGSLPMLYCGTAFAGFANGINTTILFQRVAEKLPEHLVDIGTYAALLGCNLGAATSPNVLKIIGMINSGMHFSYLIYGSVCIILAIVFLVKRDGNQTCE